MPLSHIDRDARRQTRAAAGSIMARPLSARDARIVRWGGAIRHAFTIKPAGLSIPEGAVVIAVLDAVPRPLRPGWRSPRLGPRVRDGAPAAPVASASLPARTPSPPPAHRHEPSSKPDQCRTPGPHPNANAVWTFINGTMLYTVPTTAAGCAALARFVPPLFKRWSASIDGYQGAKFFGLIARSPLL